MFYFHWSIGTLYWPLDQHSYQMFCCEIGWLLYLSMYDQAYYPNVTGFSSCFTVLDSNCSFCRYFNGTFSKLDLEDLYALNLVHGPKLHFIQFFRQVQMFLSKYETSGAGKECPPYCFFCSPLCELSACQWLALPSILCSSAHIYVISYAKKHLESCSNW